MTGPQSLVAVTAGTPSLTLGRQNPALASFMMGCNPTNKDPVMRFFTYRTNTYNNVEVKTTRPFELRGIALNHNETER